MLLGHDDQSARHAIEAVHDARPQQSGAGRLSIQMELQRVAQRPCLEAAGWMHDLPRRLVDDDDPRVFEHDLERELLGLMQLVGRFGEADGDRVAAVDALVDLGCRPADFHVSGPHDPLHAKGRVIAKVAEEKRIDADAAQVAFHDQFGRKGKRHHAPIFARVRRHSQIGGPEWHPLVSDRKHQTAF